MRWILANRSSSRHHPHNKIVGGGFFSGFVSMRVSDAWELLGLGNGAASLDGMRVRIARYRQMAPGEDPEIGCVLIRDPRFFPDDISKAPPLGFAGHIVQGKGYNLAEPSARSYFGDLLELLLGVGGGGPGPAMASARAGVRRSAAGALPAGPAGVQGRGPRCLPRVLRDHRHAHPAGPAGRPRPPGHPRR